jgi:pimeloyl-ACP methyl ester carboxylesterase
VALVELPDGRTVQVWLGGADEGPVVVVFHGCPDTRWAARTGERAARACGLRLLCVNRPGYGSSDPAASTMASVAADVAAVADRVGVLPVGALGMSVGGAYAAQLAVARPDLVRALGIVATPAMPGPVEASVEDAMESYRPDYERFVAGIRPEDPDDAGLVERWLAELPAPDATLLRSLPVEEVAASAREALVQRAGYLRDAALVLRDWGFRLEDVRAPTRLWYGADDDRNPPSVGQWWAERIADSHLVVRPRTTHLSTLVAFWPDILATLRAYLD